nr:anaerobic ribonucleoside-triphosphate reductase [Agathobaculum desmolans]
MSKNTQQSANNAILCSGSEPLIGEGVGFERIRRITGYLVGDLDRFNNAKRAEVRDRLPHVAGHAPASPRLGSQKYIDRPEL